MRCERWRLWIGCLVAVLSLAGGCSGGSGGEDESGNERDPGSDEQVEISEGCETACANFMDKCGNRAPVTREDCELDCEKNWSEKVAECVRGALACGQIEGCASDGRPPRDTGSAEDSGFGGDVGSPVDTGSTGDTGLAGDTRSAGDGGGAADAVDAGDTGVREDGEAGVDGDLAG